MGDMGVSVQEFVGRFRCYDFISATLRHETRDGFGPVKGPGGLDNSAIVPIVNGLATSFGMFRPDLYGAIRMVSGAFRDVRAKMREDTVTISGTVTFGVLERDAVRASRLKPMPVSWFYKRSDDEVRQLFEPSPEPTQLETAWA